MVLFCDPPYYGGAEGYVAMLAQGRPDGWRLSALLPGDEGASVLAEKLSAAGVAVERFRRRAWWNPGLWLDLWRRLRSLGGDVLHMNLPSVYDACHSIPGALAKAAGYRHVVTTEHLPMVPRARSHMVVKMLVSRAIDAIIVHTEWNRRKLAAYHHLPVRKMVVIPNGSPPAPAHDEAAHATRRARLGIAPQEVAIAVVGRLTARKGHRFLLDALAALQEETGRAADAQAQDRSGASEVLEAWRLLIVGEGEEEGALREQAERVGLGDRVAFLGYRDDAVEIIGASDLLVLASLVESQPLVITEAMAAGVPVIATAIYGIPEIVAHETTGLLVEAGDVASLTGALRRLLSDPALRARMGEAARRRFEEEFTLGLMARRTYEVLGGGAVH